MITALDSNVLIDLFLGTPGARDLFRMALQEGGLVLGEVVYAEVTAARSKAEVDGLLAELGVTYIPSSLDALADAGGIWVRHLRLGGRRGRVLPDFLVGSHAVHHADRLATRDRGFYRTYFRKLPLLQP